MDFICIPVSKNLATADRAHNRKRHGYAVSNMQTPPQSFQLDRDFFNEALYSEILKFWFEGLDETNNTPSFPLVQRWFGVKTTAEERAAIGMECKTRFGAALESIGSEKLLLPEPTDNQSAVKNAEEIAAPFLEEVKQAQQEDEKKGADRALALVVLLDQMPRNIYRDRDGLRLLYTHYDRIALALATALRNLPLNPMEHKSFRGKPYYRLWLWLPFIHSEHLASHKIAQQMWEDTFRRCEEANDEQALGVLRMGHTAFVEHKRILERFGRYPHRNHCLGRESTREEEEYLKEAKTFDVKQK
jgi:uncharacterized protein (DUF924 family)